MKIKKPVFYYPYVGSESMYKWSATNLIVKEAHYQIINSQINSEIEANLKLYQVDVSLKNKITFKAVDKDNTEVSWLIESNTDNLFKKIAQLLVFYSLKENLNESLNELEVILASVKNDLKEVNISSGNVIEEDYVGTKYIGIKIKSTSNLKENIKPINKAINHIVTYLLSQKITIENIGKPVIFYQLRDSKNNITEYFVGLKPKEYVQLKLPLTINNKEIIQSDSLNTIEEPIVEFTKFAIPSSKVIVTIHNNKIEELNNSIQLLNKYNQLRKLEQTQYFWYELQNFKLDSLHNNSIKIYQSVK